LPSNAFTAQNQLLFILDRMTHSQANDNILGLVLYLWGYVS
jgi:hypothetical protein